MCGRRPDVRGLVGERGQVALALGQQCLKFCITAVIGLTGVVVQRDLKGRKGFETRCGGCMLSDAMPTGIWMGSTCMPPKCVVGLKA